MALNNVVKKFETSRDRLGLEADESILGACLINPKAGVGAAVGGLAGMAVQSAMAKRSSAKAADDGGAAASWPKGRNLMAITSRRVLVCSMKAMSGKPKAITASWAHPDIVSFEVEKSMTAYPFEITFADGSSARSEGGKGTGADRLADVAGSIWG